MMRNHIDLINRLLEATKTRDETKFDFETPTSVGDLEVVREPEIEDEPAAAALPGQAASAHDTRSALRGMNIPAEARSATVNLDGIEDDHISDEEYARQAAEYAALGHDDEVLGVTGPDNPEQLPAVGAEIPPTPENLPAIVQTALSDEGVSIVPKWHMVRNLPGMMLSQIRTVGRRVFSNFTRTPIEDIQMICTLLNREVEVQAMALWVTRNGERRDALEMDFNRIMPGLHAQITVWDAMGYTFCIMRDMGGHYIYAWPASDSVSPHHLPGAGRGRLADR